MRLRQRKAAAALLILTCLFALAGTARAQGPQKLNYQVMLTDDADQPLANQTVEMVFSIWDGGATVTPLWTETQNVTTNSIGVVSVILGAVNPIDIDFDIPLWLEVEVNGEVLSPRREIVGAPYALTDEAGGAGDGHSLDADDGDPVDALYVDADGNVSIGAEGEEAALAVGGDDQYSGVASLISTVSGGCLDLREHSGNHKATLRVGDHDSAYLAIWPPGSGGSSAIYLTGNGNSSGEPWLWMEGSSRSAIFKMDLGGDDSVQLPGASISSLETKDEPGVASRQGYDLADLSYNVVENVTDRQIVVPSAGYVQAIGTAQVQFRNTTPQAHQVHFGVSETSGAFSDHAQEVTMQLPAGLPSGYFNDSVVVQGLFEVTAGANNFYFCAKEMDGVVFVGHYQLSLTFLPTSYGVVDTDDG